MYPYLGINHFGDSIEIGAPKQTPRIITCSDSFSSLTEKIGYPSMSSSSYNYRNYYHMTVSLSNDRRFAAIATSIGVRIIDLKDSLKFIPLKFPIDSKEKPVFCEKNTILRFVANGKLYTWFFRKAAGVQSIDDIERLMGKGY